MDGNSRSCPACRAELREGARFCPRCGQNVNDQSDPGAAGFDRFAGPGRTVASAFPAAPPPPATPPGGTPALSAPPAAPPAADAWSHWYTSTVPRPGYPPSSDYGPPPGYGPPSHQNPDGPPPGTDGAPGHQGFEPFLPYQPPQQPPAPPLRDDQDSSWGALALWVFFALLIVGSGTYALVTQPWKSHETLRDTASTGSGTASRPGAASASAAANVGSSHSPTASASASPSASGTAPAVSEQQAATSVAAMLSQSVSDRTAITSAYNDVDACGPNLTADAKAFTNAANSRHTLLSNLAAMPGRASLPPALLADLTDAWQASIAADQDYARWTNDEIGQGCVTDDTSDPGFQAAGVPSSKATADKQAFATGWNPIADRYGLSHYQAGQL